jgi:hypothetical protein
VSEVLRAGLYVVASLGVVIREEVHFDTREWISWYCVHITLPRAACSYVSHT